MDVGVNKPFKSRIKNYYLKYQISKCDKIDSSIINEFNKVSKEAIVKFVYNSWWNEKDGIKKEFIINSFRKSWIKLKIDGSEDDLFEYPNEIVEKTLQII